MTGTTVPPWDTVVALLRVFRVPSQEIWKTWHPLWSRARLQVLGADYPEDTPADEAPAASSASDEPQRPAHGHECDSCGAWVVNMERHQAWHWRLEGASHLGGGLRQVSSA
ncbi:hypothetical protein [Actinomadura keratinilytica]|jgi:hypothetical protein|uniref:C2H2-type domain-containing protein n=1 Tax=Actinomadura keratinilytica TaxID=547461 RepID=A0ABP7Z4W1_9ACTN